MGPAPGTKRPGGAGRKLGVNNKRTAKVYEILATHKFDPIEKLIEIYNSCGDTNTEKGIKVRVCCEIAKYSYPALRASENETNITKTELVSALPDLQKLTDNELLRLVKKHVPDQDSSTTIQ